VSEHKGMPRWPLALIAAPAAVAVWSGWVGLGELCGFGIIHPLPGIADGFRLDTAITLPVGVEAYGAYALGAWLAPGHVRPAARKFASRSAIGALTLGMAGQVIYHLLAAAHATRAPWPVVVLVACLPVVTLGFGTALTHLLRTPDTPEMHPQPAPETHPEEAPETPIRRTRTRSRTASRSRTRNAPTPAEVEVHFAADLASGQVPAVRRIQRELHVGAPRARALRDHMETLTSA
jgi:hypothetical protein